jgi:hypothetical protein
MICRLPVAVRMQINTRIFVLAMLAGAPAFGAGSKADLPGGGEVPIDELSELRADTVRLKVQRGNFFAVPIPLSSPTFGTGLALGGAYFYPQTEEQRQSQPASLTGVAGVYTNNDSYAFGVGQQSYWKADTWRFTGVAGYANFRLELIDPAPDEDGSLDWLVRGLFTQASLSRRVAGDWYLGGQLVYLDISQELVVTETDPRYLVGDNIRSLGAGILTEYDTRDLPSNPWQGSYFSAKALASRASGDVSESYQSYFARYRYYYKTRWPVVLAADINGCAKSGAIPLWDTCRLSLRGFPLTDYLGTQSLYGQAEVRWQAYKRFGLVAFGGWGYVANSVSDELRDERVPSYGAGVRFMVLKSKRINVRLDFARSRDSDAVYLGVGEAF